ncbi:hypothetical protein Lal_00036545 [Lupinus albus]|nr:hypothetical protein Lal_00036545 [Lupinus albus]
MESKDLDSLPWPVFLAKEHEMELEHLTLHEESDKRKKGLSLKASTSLMQEEGGEENSYSEIDNETMTLLVRKLSKFLKRKGGVKQFQKKETKNPNSLARIPKNVSSAMSVGRWVT